jgi:hypothetical protein
MTFEQIKESASPEVRAKMEKVKIDFKSDNILPELNQSDIDNLQLKPHKVRLKTGIIRRQDFRHSDVKDDDVNMLLATALYAPDKVVPGKSKGYMNFLKTLGNDDNSLVLLDLKETKDEVSGEEFYDIVHYYFIDDYAKRKL